MQTRRSHCGGKKEWDQKIAENTIWYTYFKQTNVHTCSSFVFFVCAHFACARQISGGRDTMVRHQLLLPAIMDGAEKVRLRDVAQYGIRSINAVWFICGVGARCEMVDNKMQIR